MENFSIEGMFFMITKMDRKKIRSKFKNCKFLARMELMATVKSYKSRSRSQNKRKEILARKKAKKKKNQKIKS